MILLTIAVWLAALPVAALLAIFTAEIVAGLRPLAPGEAGGDMPRTVVLIPAHNEAAAIGATVAALAGEGAEVLVVADNCADATADAARAAGARVAERQDAIRRGKGFALAFGRETLAADPPEVVVVLDADCRMEPGGIAALARDCAASGVPVQSRNLIRPDLAAPVTVQLSTFAFMVKNLVRQRGAGRLGGVAVLNGTGMALPWDAFARAPLASDDIVEDLALGIWLTREGRVPRFLESARTWSDAAAPRDMIAQRTRWERGFVATARRRALPLIAAGLRAGDRAATWLGLHLLVPPLALLFAVGGAVALVAALAGAIGAGWGAFALLCAALLLAGGATLLAWWREGRAMIGARALMGVPGYVLAKLPIYLGLLRRNRAGWVRTRRPGE